MENIDKKKLSRLIGENIRYYRRQIPHLTQEILAERVGCSVSNIGKIECGASMPSVEQLVKIANELNVGVDRLVTDMLRNKSDFYIGLINEHLSEQTPEQRSLSLQLFALILKVVRDSKELI